MTTKQKLEKLEKLEAEVVKLRQELGLPALEEVSQDEESWNNSDCEWEDSGCSF